MNFSVSAVPDVPMIQPGDNLGMVLTDCLIRAGQGPLNGDILVVCQKIVSKAEGRIADLRTVVPSPFARALAARTASKDPRVVEVILRETTRIVKMDRGHLIVETGPGWVCANAGVDESNSLDDHTVVLLPVDPDASARRLAETARARTKSEIAVIITDTFGRPWREGLIDFAIGVAGIEPLLDLRGQPDLTGRVLRHTVNAHVDALAAAAGLLMRKGTATPAAVIRGYEYQRAESGGTKLLRAPELDLFR